MSLVIPTNAFERATVRYIRHQRALQKAFDHPTWILTHLARYLTRQGAQDLDAQQFKAWSMQRPYRSPTTRRDEAMVVRRLCLYRRRTESACFVPDSAHFPREVPPIQPVILGAAEVARMLEAIEAWRPHPQQPLRRAAMRMAVILFYTTGLRRGELVRLTLSDIDLSSGTLRIRDSKFHKSRMLPLSVSATRELRAYLRQRLETPWDISPEAPLLGHHHGVAHFRGYCGEALSNAFRRLFIAAHVHDGHGRRPRLHDVRHSFAVQALLRWYRAGVDVQAKLPQLSMYMGHVSIVSTAYYLHFIPEIAQAANRRFERHLGTVMKGGRS